MARVYACIFNVAYLPDLIAVVSGAFAVVVVVAGQVIIGIDTCIQNGENIDTKLSIDK